MKRLLFLCVLLANVFGFSKAAAQQDTVKTSSLGSYTYPELSALLIDYLRNEKPTNEIQQKLAEAHEDSLKSALDTEAKNKAFWLNVYNAYVQILLMENPDLFKDRDAVFGYNFFSTPQVTIAGQKLSFDDIEHGIVRRSKNKLSGGYANKLFPGDFEKKFRWAEVDPRIHFALNCGAKSCPYIAAYEQARVEEQLDITTRQYLEKTTDYYPEEHKVVVNRLMSWFRADFGGKAGVIKMLKDYEIIPQNVNPSLEFKEYDWTLELGNYKDI